MQILQRVADRADLGIDLKAALGGGEVEAAERAVEAPALRRRRGASCAGGRRRTPASSADRRR